METVVLDREQAVAFIADLLATFEPSARLAISHSDGTIIINPERKRRDLTAWAEQIGDQYDDVFRRLAQ